MQYSIVENKPLLEQIVFVVTDAEVGDEILVSTESVQELVVRGLKRLEKTGITVREYTSEERERRFHLSMLPPHMSPKM